MALVEIRTALETKLNALTPTIATAWENVPLTPVVGTAYQQVNLMIADTLNPTLGGNHYRVKGTFSHAVAIVGVSALSFVSNAVRISTSAI